MTTVVKEIHVFRIACRVTGKTKATKAFEHDPDSETSTRERARRWARRQRWSNQGYRLERTK